MRRKLAVALIVAASIAAAAAAALLLPRSTLPGTTVADVPLSLPPPSKGFHIDAAPFAPPRAGIHGKPKPAHASKNKHPGKGKATPGHTTTGAQTTTTSSQPVPHTVTHPHDVTTTDGAPPTTTAAHAPGKKPSSKPPSKPGTTTTTTTTSTPPPTTTTTKTPPPTTTTTSPPPTTTTTAPPPPPTTTTTVPPPPPPPKPPTLRLPDAVTVDATAPSGTAVSFSASASDSSGGSLQVACQPASGATFPIATTTVHCSATDDHGQSANGTFTVHVNGATEQITNLDSTVTNMDLDSGLKKTIQASLDKAASVSKPKDACDAINDVPTKVVDAAGNPKPQITVPQAQTLVHGAVNIETVLACLAANSPVDDVTHKLLGLLQTIGGLDISDGESSDLTGKAREIAKQVLNGNNKDACNKLGEFAKRLDADSSGKNPKLSAAQAAQLSAIVGPIASQLGC